MTRKRGTPRRGSAWYARKEQRQRREELERALVIASSLLRKKTREEEKVRLSDIAEKEIDRGTMDTVMLEGSNEQLYPACIVEEDPTLADLPTLEAPCDTGRSGRGEGNLNLGLDDDPPGCIVEEVPWPDLEAEVDAGCATRKEGWQDDVKSRTPEAEGDDLRGSLREEHLALVFELRGHMADLEYRAHIMGQRLDAFLDVFPFAPARQSFAFTASSTWKTKAGDRSPFP
jgi:hypothetical protein